MSVAGVEEENTAVKLPNLSQKVLVCPMSQEPAGGF